MFQGWGRMRASYGRGWEKGLDEGILASTGLHLARPYGDCRPRAMQEVLF